MKNSSFELKRKEIVKKAWHRVSLERRMLQNVFVTCFKDPAEYRLKGKIEEKEKVLKYSLEGERLVVS